MWKQAIDQRGFWIGVAAMIVVVVASNITVQIPINDWLTEKHINAVLDDNRRVFQNLIVKLPGILLVGSRIHVFQIKQKKLCHRYHFKKSISIHKTAGFNTGAYSLTMTPFE